MLMDLTEKVDNMQDQKGNVNKMMETIIKNQMEMLEMRKTVRDIKNVFDEMNTDKESMNLKVSEQELPKLIHKEKKQ